jgi:hypothetical protein
MKIEKLSQSLNLNNNKSKIDVWDDLEGIHKKILFQQKLICLLLYFMNENDWFI